MASGIGNEFMLMTRYAYLDAADQQKGLPAPPVVSTESEGGIELPPPGEPVAVSSHCYTCTAGAGFT